MVGAMSFTCMAVLVTMVTFDFIFTGDARMVYPGRFHGDGQEDSLRRTISDIIRAIRNLNRSGCANSNINVIPCKNNNDTGCSRTENQSDNSTLINVPVTFNNTFRTPPGVVVGFAGMKLELGEEINLNSNNVTERGFNIKITVKGILPDHVNLFWIACKKATN